MKSIKRQRTKLRALTGLNVCEYGRCRINFAVLGHSNGLFLALSEVNRLNICFLSLFDHLIHMGTGKDARFQQFYCHLTGCACMCVKCIKIVRQGQVYGVIAFVSTSRGRSHHLGLTRPLRNLILASVIVFCCLKMATRYNILVSYILDFGLWGKPSVWAITGLGWYEYFILTYERCLSQEMGDPFPIFLF